MNNRHLMLLVNAIMTELNALHGIPDRFQLIAANAIDTDKLLEDLLYKELKHIRVFNIQILNTDDQSIERLDGSHIMTEVLETVWDSIATKLSAVLKASSSVVEDLLRVPSDKPKKRQLNMGLSQVGAISNAAIKEIVADLVADERVNFERIPGFLPRVYSQSSENQFYIE